MLRASRKLLKSISGKFIRQQKTKYFQCVRFFSNKKNIIHQKREELQLKLKNDNRLTINNFLELKKWLEQDLLDLRKTPIPIEDIRNRLINISQGFDLSLKADPFVKQVYETLLSAISASNKNFIKRMQELYIFVFFQEEFYREKVKSFTSGRSEDILLERLKYENRLPTLDYLLVIKEDPRHLDQIDRACVIIKAALDLYISFKKNLSSNLQENTFYEYFFSTTIVPGQLFNEFCANRDSAHIVVMREGQVYEVIVVEDDEIISTRKLKMKLEEIMKYSIKQEQYHFPIGALTTAKRFLCFEARNENFTVNQYAFLKIEKAIFTLCLDNGPYSDSMAEEMYIHRFRNRYFGSTQFVIGQEGEAAVIGSYLKMEAAPAMEIVNEIYRDSLNVIPPCAAEPKIIPKKLEFKLDPQTMKILESDTNQIIHYGKSSYRIDVGLNFFKELNLSPNVTIYFLVLLATYELTKNLSIVNHAISLRDHHGSPMQLDWIYVSLDKLKRFIDGYNEHAELEGILTTEPIEQALRQFESIEKITMIFYQNKTNWNYLIIFPNAMRSNLRGMLYQNNVIDLLNDILRERYSSIQCQQVLTHIQLSLILKAVPELHILTVELKQLFLSFTDLVKEHKEKISFSQKGLSPTFFVKKHQGSLFDQLVEFYIYLGKFFPAYRNYLFRAYRNPNSIDIMASSLRLPNSIKGIGRYGTLSEILMQFGMHIFVNENTTELVFIPNKDWVDNLDDLSKQVKIWADRLQFIAFFNT